MVYIEYMFNNKLIKSVLVLGKWMLMPHDGQNIFVPKPREEGYKHSWF